MQCKLVDSQKSIHLHILGPPQQVITQDTEIQHTATNANEKYIHFTEIRTEI